MRNRYLFHGGIVVSLFILFTLIGEGQGNAVVLFSGITSTLSEIKDFISGINSFISSIVSISKLIGFSTFVLFLFILLLSSGLSAIGIPRGRLSFIVSLLIADSIWIMWARSFNPESYDFLAGIGRTNLIIILPVIVLGGAVWLLPKVFRKLRHKIKLSRTAAGSGLSGSETKKLSEEFAEYSKGFQNSLLNDVLISHSNDEVVLSHETINFSRKLTDLLGGLDKDK